MSSRTLLSLLLLLSVLQLLACGSTSSRVADDDAGRGDTDLGDDAALPQCGDEREPLEVDPAAIVNGSETWDPEVVDLSSGQALAVGAIMTRGGRGGEWSNACTATLVAPSLVLTAAHCVLDFWGGGTYHPSQIRFAVGPDAASPVHIFEAEEVHSDDRYAMWGGNAAHDVGLLVLWDDATEVLPEILPIAPNCAPLGEEHVGRDVQNVGYGSTAGAGQPGGDNSKKLWVVEELVEVSATDFTVYGHGEAAVCHGDSGGPSLMTMDDDVVRVIGTVSWGDPSCVDYDHFARTDDNCDLIQSFLPGCGAVTEAGYCDEDRAVYCQGEAVVEIDCAETSEVCALLSTGESRCADPDDTCLGETLTGRCDGTVAIYCEDNALVRDDCAADGGTCAADDDGHSRCQSAVDDCDGLGWQGRCDGDDAIWCEGGEERRRRCADCEQSCTLVVELEAYYCE